MKDIHVFLDKVYENLAIARIDVARFQMDHVCFRTDSTEDYAATKAYFEGFSDLIVESNVNGRPIACYRLQKPIVYKNRVLRVVEVPAPKAGNLMKRGLEHVEFVIDQSFEHFAALNAGIDFKFPNKRAALNRELSISFGDCNVKLHHLPLEAVIEIEKWPQPNDALMALDFFNVFASYNPQVSGSIPLGVGGASADLDVLFETQNFEEFERTLGTLGDRILDLKIKELRLQDVKSLIATFKAGDLLVECVVQNLDVYQQRANLHLLIESRLLNIAGDKARAEIAQLKKSGLKTEPAFAHYFKLNGDPYHKLLELQKMSEVELYTSFIS